MSGRPYDACDCRRGYFASESDKYGMSLERCDTCATYADDDAAAVAFVRELEKGEPHAIEQARLLAPEVKT